MELIEKIFESEHIDSKNILNKQPNVSIDNDFIELIENEGVTSENLAELKVPVFMYNTQITIHGIFNGLNNNGVIGVYKYLILNKNKSLGVKYNAIDYEKKKRIYSILHKLVPNSSVKHSSTEFYFFIQKRVFDITEARKIALELIEQKKNIDTNLFYGAMYVNIYSYMGAYYVVSDLVIRAILEKNILPLISQFTGLNENEIIPKYNQILETEKYERDLANLKYKQDMQQREIAKNILMEQAEKTLLNAGYIKLDIANLHNDLEVVRIDTNYMCTELKFEHLKFSKKDRQKKFRYKNNKVENLNDKFEYSFFESEFSGNVIKNVWIKK